MTDLGRLRTHKQRDQTSAFPLSRHRGGSPAPAFPGWESKFLSVISSPLPLPQESKNNGNLSRNHPLEGYNSSMKTAAISFLILPALLITATPPCAILLQNQSQLPTNSG